jgi:hypothetical protein
MPSGNKSFANVRHTYQNDDEYTITVTVSDSVTTPATATTNISVNNVAPSITQGDTVTFNVNEDSSRTLTLNATDPGLDDTLTWNILNQPAHGVASVSATPTGTSQVISYTPTANFNGTDTFEVQVRDPDGGADTIQVSMNVVAQPDAPSGLALSGSVNALDEGETFTLSGSFTLTRMPARVSPSPSTGAMVAPQPCYLMPAWLTWAMATTPFLPTTPTPATAGPGSSRSVRWCATRIL